MNYFEFYDLKQSFTLDSSELKKQYIQKSRECHPDFHLNDSLEEQDFYIKQSAINNKAYKTLSNEESRMKYILELEGIISDNQKDELPQDFLFEMMDINEQLEEQKSSEDEAGIQRIKEEINAMREQFHQQVLPILNTYPDVNKADLIQVKTFYLKSKYLDRIQEHF